MKLTAKLFNGEILEKSILKNSVTIGRSNKCDFIIAHEGISREHLQLECTDGYFYVKDLNSKNGVYIDGTKIEANQRILYLSTLTLTFGSVQSLEVELDDGPEPSVTSKSSVFSTDSSPSQMTRTMRLSLPKKEKAETKNRLPANAQRSKKTSNTDTKSIFINLLAFILLAGTAYWYWSKNNADKMDEVPAQHQEVKILE
jgi:pSer/pThr/pTyr-binding forkhead associated (FHA) protein